MTGKAIHYFACGNTAKGFTTLLDTNLTGYDRLLRLRGGTARARSALMRHCAEGWRADGHDVEQLHCAQDPDVWDAVLAPSLLAGIVGAGPPHVFNMPVGHDEADCGGSPVHLQDKIDLLGSVVESEQTQAHAAFARALKIHDAWEALYIAALDGEAHRRETERLLGWVLPGRDAPGPGTARHRFMGGATPCGAMDFIPELTAGIAKRYFLKGRPGTGKSTLLKRLAAAAEGAGHAVEVYHCGFDPDSLDMVILRGSGIAVIDTTAPHEYYPSRESDEIFDLYEKIIAPGTDERHAGRITALSGAYRDAIREGTAALARAKAARDEADTCYGQGMTEEARERVGAFMAGLRGN